ncbi:hypothetical protein [Thalassospira alkalitolerans]|uniref:hypothetical protein n=1 Tax=Thalassospira alkalitolerans TaxID=1293890 RepID=UPI003AA90319
MLSIYIDHNVFINYFESKFLKENHEDISVVIDKLIDIGYLFPYSPAHIEEIELFRVSGRGDSGCWFDQLSCLGEISNEKCPISANVYPKEGHFLFYDIKLCYKNITSPNNFSETMRMLPEEFHEDMNVADKVKSYQGVIRKIVAQLKEPVEMPCDLMEMKEGSIQSFIAMLLERKKIEESIDFLKSDGPSKRILKKFEKINPHEVFDNDSVLKFLRRMKEKEKISEFTTSNLDKDSEVFYDRQRNLTNLFRFLNSIGYSKEHNKLKAKNRLHDTSHALYATYADVFVTNDKKLKKQTQAIFSFLKYPTQVISQEEFIKNYG